MKKRNGLANPAFASITSTSVPTATATIRFCTGNTRFTLASAFSLSMATKMLSTTL